MNKVEHAGCPFCNAKPYKYAVLTHLPGGGFNGQVFCSNNNCNAAGPMVRAKNEDEATKAAFSL